MPGRAFCAFHQIFQIPPLVLFIVYARWSIRCYSSHVPDGAVSIIYDICQVVPFVSFIIHGCGELYILVIPQAKAPPGIYHKYHKRFHLAASARVLQGFVVRVLSEFWVIHESCEVAKSKHHGVLRWWCAWADDDSLRLRMTHESR